MFLFGVLQGVTHQPKQNKTLGTNSPFIVQIRFASRCSSQNVSHLMAPESKKWPTTIGKNVAHMLHVSIFTYIWLKSMVPSGKLT